MMQVTSTTFTPSIMPTSTKVDGKKKSKKKFKTMSLGEFHKTLKKVDEPLTSSITLESFEPKIRAYRPNPRNFYRNYDGRVSSDFKGPQYVLIQDVVDQILFSQKTVSDFNSVGETDYPLDYLADAMFIKFQKTFKWSGDGALDVVDMGNGVFTSVDNRRLLIAKKIGVVDRTYGIWIKVHKSTDQLSKGLQRRFDGATTWGEAVRGRIGSSKPGYKKYPTIMTSTLGGREPASSQLLPLSVGCDLSALHPTDAKNIEEKSIGGTIQI